MAEGDVTNNDAADAGTENVIDAIEESDASEPTSGAEATGADPAGAGEGGEGSGSRPGDWNPGEQSGGGGELY